jgi:hypothetical protein
MVRGRLRVIELLELHHHAEDPGSELNSTGAPSAIADGAAEKAAGEAVAAEDCHRQRNRD